MHAHMKEISIAPYREGDRPDVVAGYVDLQEVERQFTDTRRPGTEIADAYVDGLLADVSEKQGTVFVAREGDAFAGFVVCWLEQEENVAETPDSTTYGYIPDAYVAPAYRGQGVFAQLNQKAEEYLASLPEVKRIRINVLAHNARALAAYRKAGYSDYEIMLEKKLKDS